MSDRPSRQDRVLSDLLLSALVPDGYRPQSDEEIERMLGALGQQPIPADKRDRMLGKALGKIPKRWEVEQDSVSSFSGDTSEAQELAEMHRAKGDDLPMDLERLLREMEERAAHPPDDGDDDE